MFYTTTPITIIDSPVHAVPAFPSPETPSNEPSLAASPVPVPDRVINVADVQIPIVPASRAIEIGTSTLLVDGLAATVGKAFLSAASEGFVVGNIVSMSTLPTSQSAQLHNLKAIVTKLTLLNSFRM